MTVLDASDDVRMYSARQLADLWGCSLRHIYELITRGELRTVELGIGRAKLRVPAASALEFMQRRGQQVPAAAALAAATADDLGD